MSQSRITGAVLLCWEDCTSILSKHLTTLLQRPIQLCRMVEDYDYWCVASINERFTIPELHSLLDALSATTVDFPDLIPDGASLLAAIIVLAIMILPSIIKVSVNALDAVPKEYEDASLALGATPVETWFRVSAPAAKSGIAAAVVLGVGRAIGEAMAVMMVSGNAPNMPSLFESVRFLTTAVASEMSYASGLQRQALFSIALVLYVFIMLINAALNFFLKRKKE